MKRIFAILVVLVIVIGWNGVAEAIVNPGFESGLTGWTVPSGNASAVTSYEYLSPMEGSNFLSILAGDANKWYEVYQSIDLNTGDILSGYAAFDWDDNTKYYDGAKVYIKNSSGVTIGTPWSENGSGHPDYWNGPWTSWSWTAPSSDKYTLVYGACNTIDTVGDSYGLFDAAQVDYVVPEPATMLLLGSGLLGLFGFKRKRK